MIVSARKSLVRSRRTQTAGARWLLPWLGHAWILPLLAGVLITAPASADTQTNQVDLTALPLEALMNLDVHVVYGASRLEQKTTEAPSSVTIVTADEIKKYGYRTLADVLASVQGFYVSYDRNYAFLGTRGINLGDFNDRILLLVNGHRVNNDFTDGAFIGTAFILDIDLIDRVEIIRGPGSAIYGNNAFLGVINVITRTGKQLNGFETSGEYGAFDTYKGRVSFGKLFDNGVQLLLSGTYYDSGGQDELFYKQFDTPAQNNGVADDMDADRAGSAFGSVSYGDFALEGAFNDREKINPTAQFNLTTFNDPRLRTTDERSYVELKYTHNFADIVDVAAQVYYDSYSHQIGYPQSLLSGTNVLFSRFSSERDLGEWWGTQLQLNKKLWDRHILTLGAEYRDDFLQDSRLVVEGAPEQGFYSRTNRTSYGIYGQGDFEIITNLHLVAGVRYDQYGEFSPSTDPRVALIYHPFTTSTLKAIYGTAFRAPSFYELSTSDQPLRPERITGYELVYEQELGPHLRSSLSGFYNDMSDLLVFSSGSFTNFNAQTKGVELAFEGNWANGVRGRASYSFQDTRNSSVGWQMPDSPNHLLKFDLSVPVVSDKLFAGLEFQYTSDRRSLHSTTDIDGQPITVQGEEAGGFGVINFTLFSQKLIKNLEISASVYNLLDRHYVDPASQFHVQDVIVQDGRSFRVKLTYRF
ncbi:MAG TPA: TonB-dependent receptor [Verrucomicrobiae bacterium]|nr:TonB-dependent receptor [Verrucomicrobiae bacterium]